MKTLHSQWQPSVKYGNTFYITEVESNKEVISLFPEGLGNSRCWCFTIELNDGSSVYGSDKSMEVAKKKAVEKAQDLGFIFETG